MMRRLLALLSLMGAVVFGQVPVGTPITNVAQTSHEDAAGETFVTISNAATTVVSEGYHLELAKSTSATVVAPGGSLTYTITVLNSGNVSPEPFAIKDTLSTGVTYVSSSPAAAVSGQFLNWTISELPGGESVVISLVVLVDSNLSAEEVISNIAWLAVPDGFELSSESVDVTVGAFSDLVLTKLVAEEISMVGDTAHYTINVYNTGNASSLATIVTDELPEHVSFASASHGGTFADGTVTWMLNELTEGDTSHLSLAVVIDESMPANTNLQNTAMVVNNAGVSSASSVSSLANPWIQTIEKWAAEGEYGYGDTIEFVLRIHNSSPDPVNAITVTDTLPHPLQFISASSGGTFADGAIHWNLGTLNSGNTKNLSVVTVVGSLLEARPLVTNRAWISTSNAGSSYGDHTVSLAAFPELGLDKSSASTVQAGDSLIYTFIMSNTGNSMAHDVVLMDTLPAYLTFGSATNVYSYDEISHSILWNVGEIASNAIDSVKLVTYVAYPVIDGTTLQNTAYLTCVEGSASQSTAVTEVQSAPGLFLHITGTTVAVAGDTISYTLKYRNQGTEIATAVVLYDTLSAEVEYIDASPAHMYNPETGIISWNLSDLAPGDSGVVYVTAKVRDEISQSTRVPNGGLISCEQGVQCIAVQFMTVRAPVMNIVLIGDTTYILAGELIRYDLSFDNVGDTTATNVVVVDSLPEEVSFLGASNNGVYDPTSHSVTWYVGDLDPVGPGNGNPGKTSNAKTGSRDQVKSRKNPASEFTVDVSVNYPLPNGMELANTAYIYAEDILQASATWLAIVVANPDFLFTKTADLEVFPGDTISYELDIANYGTDHASGVSILDTLDSRVTFVSATGDYIYDATSHSLSWTIGALNVEQQVRFTIETIVEEFLEDGAQVGNRAWLVSDQSDAIPAEAITTNILPLSLVLDAQPRQILGNGSSFSTLAAHVYSFLGNPVPDGITVNFYTEDGTIPDSVATTSTIDGVAFSILVSDTVISESVTAIPYARAIYSATDYADDTTQVVFVIGAFDGTIYNYSGYPEPGIRVELRYAASGNYVAHDTTNADGYYLIPIYRDDLYQIVYTLIGPDGVPYETVQEIAIDSPNEGSLVTNLNSVSGWIYDELTGLPIPEDSILVIVNGVVDTLATLGKTASYQMVDSSYTDTTGQYFFTNLQPGLYTVQVIYNGISSYSDGVLDINLTTPGLYIVNANITLRASPFYMKKTVDKVEAAVGDTVHYNVNFGTQDITFNDSVAIVDYLPAGLKLIESSLETDANTTFEGLDPISNEMRFSRSDIQLGDSLHIEFDAKITIDAGLGWIENRVLISNGIDSTWSHRNPATNAKTKIIFPFLKVTKQSNRKVIEVGDVITYTVKITNTSIDDLVHDFVIDDVLPYGFKYRKNSTYWDQSKIADPVIQEAAGKRLAMTWLMSDTLQPGETFEMKYRIIAGMNSREGTNTNEVMARAHTLLGFPVISNLAAADVIVKPGLFSDRGLIIGKVYYDLNGNGIHDQNERTVKNVELIMENGARILTDEFGKYSVPDVEAGMHVIRVNENTLPPLSRIILDSPDYLGDTQSKMVRVAAAGIAKTNFALQEISKPGKVTGTVFYDLNRNGVRDPDEATQSNVVIMLNDSSMVLNDSLGYFMFPRTGLGDMHLSVDVSSLPSYAKLFTPEPALDSSVTQGNRWDLTLFSGDSVNIDIPLEMLELFSVLSKEATLEMRTQMLTEEFRLLVYKPWSLLIRIGFVSGSATLQSEIFGELKNIGDLMKWQTQINLDIVGHTDNLPVAPGSPFSDNQALSEARAQAIRNYLVGTMGISADRITAAGQGSSIPLADGRTPEGRALNRRVELVFYNAQEEDSEFSQLEFMYDINYTGEIPIHDVRFHQSLPPGFIYKPKTARLDSVSMEPISRVGDSDVWSFGDWGSEERNKFDVSMKPDDFDQIGNSGVVSAYLEMVDEDGNTIVTDSLETRISTLVETLSFNMVLEGTQFDVGSADLKPSAYPSLRKLGDFLAWQPDIEIVIEGFTDNRGSLEFNMLLSDWRATSVKNFLLENYTLNPENIHTHGLGPHYPAGDNETWIGRATNRRVEVLVNAEVGEAALLELDVIKESLKQKIVIPVDALSSMSPDSALSIPADQASTVLLNMSFPAFAGADSMAITLALPNDLEYVDDAATIKSWGISIERNAVEVTPAVHINAPEGVRGVRDLYMSIQLFKDGVTLSSTIEKILKVNLVEVDAGNE